MLKRTITYPDFDGEMLTEDFFFHLNKAEIIEFEAMTKDGLSKTLKKAMADKDRSVVIPMVKELILRSYGEKSLDGKRFIKTPELREAFYQTEAYSILFMELLESLEAQQEFVMGIIPSSMHPSVSEAMKKADLMLPDA